MLTTSTRSTPAIIPPRPMASNSGTVKVGRPSRGRVKKEVRTPVSTSRSTSFRGISAQSRNCSTARAARVSPRTVGRR